MTFMADHKELLEGFRAISLEQLDLAFSRRVETKFIFSADQLDELLSRLQSGFSVLEVNGIRLCPYQTQYFDTDKLQFFTDHHRGIIRRQKVRVRKYVATGTVFLEVKEKKDKYLTTKRRVGRDDMSPVLSSSEKSFLREAIGSSVDLRPSLKSSYERITLVNNERTERLTLDLSLRFMQNGDERSLQGLVIAELKQEKKNRNSEFFQICRQMGIRPRSVSKYCYGISSLNQRLKSNRFQHKHLYINNMISNGTT